MSLTVGQNRTGGISIVAAGCSNTVFEIDVGVARRSSAFSGVIAHRKSHSESAISLNDSSMISSNTVSQFLQKRSRMGR